MSANGRRPDSGSSRSAWNDDGLDAPGRPTSSTSEISTITKREAKSAASSVARRERKPKPKKEKKQNICQKIIHGIWSTRHTQELEDNESKAKTVIRELIIYLIFLGVICAITFGMTSEGQFTLSKVMSDLFVSGASASGVSFAGQLTQADFWKVAEGPLMDGLYWEDYYNGESVPQGDRGYIYFENKLLGVPRMRQLRVKNDSCVVYKHFSDFIPLCYAEWSSKKNDESPYGLGSETAWVFHSEKEMNGTAHSGILTEYPGSGYYQDLTTSKNASLQIIGELKRNMWIDRGTRVVFIDFTVYNPNINLFCVVRLVTEYPATGGAITSNKIITVKLLRYVTIGDYIILGCEFVFSAFILYYLIEELIEMHNQGCKNYFSEFWNWMDVIVIILAFVCIAFDAYRTFVVQKLIDELLGSPEQFADFVNLSKYQMWFNYCVAIMAFLAWFKLFKYISFNKTMTQLVDTIAQSKKDLGSFMVMFLIVFMAFAQLAYLFFGTEISDFKSIKDAILTQLRIILGDFNFAALDAAHAVFGPLYFIMYIMFVFFILFNMFLAIINDTYSAVKADTSDSANEFEVMDFFKNQYNKMLDKLNIKRDRIADIQDALAAADANNDNTIEYEEWKNELLARGYKEQEIEEAFKKFDVDGNRVLDAQEQADMLKALEAEKQAVDKDIGQVENKLGKTDRPTTGGSRPTTSRARTGRRRSMTAKARGEGAENDAETPAAQKKAGPKVVSEVAYGEFTQLTRRVDRMEHSIGSIVSKIDMVLIKLEGMERAKLKRREAMAQLLDNIAGADDASEAEKREQMERLVREELERWDSESAVSRPASAYSRPGTSAAKSRPGTGMK